MMKSVLILWMAGWIWLSVPGCTTRAWYEGMREQQRQGCYRYAGQDEIQRCLDRVNDQTYEQYRRSREEMRR